MSDGQDGTILGEWGKFEADPQSYAGSTMPDCMSLSFDDLWTAHASHRFDPKYFLFRREERRALRPNWKRVPLSAVMKRRLTRVLPQEEPTREFVVLTLGQNGEIRPRQAGKGNNPPEWYGHYFEGMSSSWFSVEEDDLVYSSIDLWKGCASIVPAAFGNGLVTKEFPIYTITDPDLLPGFLRCILRSRYYQRAFRAITTGHSNRRRTQTADFESLEIAYPESRDEQLVLIRGIEAARTNAAVANEHLAHELLEFSNVIDGRGYELLPEVDGPVEEEDQ